MYTWNIYLYDEYERDWDKAPVMATVAANDKSEAVEIASKQLDFDTNMLIAVQLAPESAE